MFKMLLPVLIIVLSNVFYNIATKSTPDGINTFCGLTVTYAVSALISAAVFLLQVGIGGAGAEFQKLNWTSYILGISIIGLEAGYILLYRMGWKISLGSVVCNITLAIVLLFIGMLLYKEQISLRQVLGIAVCGAGLFLLSK